MRAMLGGFTWLLFQVLSGTGQPPAPFVDQGACLFECRQFGQAIASTTVVAFESHTTRAFAQVTSRPSLRKPKRAVPARIVDYDYDGVEGSPLRIRFSDDATVEIPLERGRFAVDDRPIAQAAFTDIQIAEDGLHIGWAAEYMICAQSYPCPAEVVIFGPGRKLRYVGPGAGIVWEWRFWNGGRQIVVKSGFPHGDTSWYQLFDSDTGRRRAQFDPALFHSGDAPPPRWVFAIGFNPDK